MVETELRPSIEPRFEDRLLQSELISSRQVSLREVLSKRETDFSGLPDAPINVQVRDLGDAIGYIASFQEDEASLGGERLVHVLKNAKPVGKDGQIRPELGKVGIVNDWQIAQKQQRKWDVNAKLLYEDHIADDSIIAKHFKEFGANHFAAFWEAINSSLSERNFAGLRFDSERLISEQKALAMYGLDFLTADFERFIKVISINVLLSNTFAQFVRNEMTVDMTDEFGFVSDRCYRFFRNLEEEKRDSLITNFFNQLPDDKARKELIYGAVCLFNFPQYRSILVDDNGNSHHVLGDKFHGRIEQISRISDDEVEAREGDSYIRVLFEQDQKTGHKEKKLSAVRFNDKPQQGEIVPAVVWKKDKKTGKREYFCGKVSDDLIHAFPDMFSFRHDALLGQIVVAGHSEELKRILPTRLPLVKGGKKQNMLEPQMPVFVPLFSRAYLNRSPVIAGFEDLGNKR